MTDARPWIENKVFDCLKWWKQFHPRTWWPMVDAVADLLEEKPMTEFRVGEFGNGTTTQSNVSAQIEFAASPAEGPTPPDSVKLVGNRPPTEAEIEYGKTLAPMAEECLARNAAAGTKPLPHCPRPDCGGSVVFNRVKHGVPFMSCTKCKEAFPCAVAADFTKFFTAGPKPSPRCPKCQGTRISLAMLSFGRFRCPDCPEEYYVQTPTDFAQFFTPSAGEPR